MTTIGPYHLDARVGRGATGTVWRATRPGPVPRVVAVKRAPAGAHAEGGKDRLRREAAVLAELDHPHIIRILEVLDDGHDVAIVMPFARGGSLHDLLEERGRLTAGETVAVLAPVADALGSAHRRGLVHGDVKPANILFTVDGEPLLGDFGVARHLRRPGVVPAGKDGTRPVEGTTGYVDPELVATGRPEPGNDVYGLAVVAYLCLTGRPPHVGATEDEALAAAEAGEHLSLADEPAVPRALAEVVEAAMDRHPARRPATATALARTLRSALPPGTPMLPGPARSVAADRGAEWCSPPDVVRTRVFGPRPPAPDPPPRRARPVLVAAVAVALVAVAVAIGFGVPTRSAGERSPASVTVAARARPSGVACPDLEPLPVPPGAEALEADVLGRGCPVPLVWDGRILSLRLDPSDVVPRTYELVPRWGGPGQLVVGDWDCDGTQTPGYYQPATGVVSAFDAVPARVGGELGARTRDSGVLDGRAVVVTGADGCDVVDVSPPA